jgi:hypothetical protein
VQLLLQSQSFSIDEYQREYKWEKENIDELLTDLRDKFLTCYQHGHKTNDFSQYKGMFSGLGEFNLLRDHVASLLLLPADVNRSFQDKNFEEKAPHYAKENLYAASLTASTYQHQPKFEAFRTRQNLPFTAFERFGKAEQMQRRELVRALVHDGWSSDRINKVLV